MTNTTQSELACNKLIDLINNEAEETLPKILKSQKFKDLLDKITHTYYAKEICNLALERTTNRTLPTVLKALKEPLGKITNPDYALKVCTLALGMATKDTFTEVLEALKVPLSIIKLTKVLEALQKHIK